MEWCRHDLDHPQRLRRFAAVAAHVDTIVLGNRNRDARVYRTTNPHAGNTLLHSTRSWHVTMSPVDPARRCEVPET